MKKKNCLNIPSPTWSRTRGSSNPTDNCGKNFLDIYSKLELDGEAHSLWYMKCFTKSSLTSITIWSISHISIRSTELRRESSSRTPPSPPPTTKTCVRRCMKWVWTIHENEIKYNKFKRHQDIKHENAVSKEKQPVNF